MAKIWTRSHLLSKSRVRDEETHQKVLHYKRDSETCRGAQLKQFGLLPASDFERVLQRGLAFFAFVFY